MADDDDVAEDWEDADTEELERRMEVRQKEFERKEKKVAKNKSKNAKLSSLETQGIESTMPVPLEVKTQLPLRIQDSERTEYVAPIKILKRQGDPKNNPSSTTPQSSSAATASPGSGSRKQKSLAEREADYASARARILGSDYKPGGGDTPPPPAAVVNSGPSPRGNESVKRQPKGPNGTRGFKS